MSPRPCSIGCWIGGEAGLAASAGPRAVESRGRSRKDDSCPDNRIDLKWSAYIPPPFALAGVLGKLLVMSWWRGILRGRSAADSVAIPGLAQVTGPSEKPGQFSLGR